MSGPVQDREFVRAIEGLSRQIAEVQATGQKTLDQARLTNGRVSTLENTIGTHSLRLSRLESADTASLTKRDMWVAVGTLGAAASLVKWLPMLIRMVP